jgi:hypothetical protein
LSLEKKTTGGETVYKHQTKHEAFGDLIGQVIEGSHGLRFKIIGLGRNKNTVHLKSERDGQEFDLNGTEARIMLAPDAPKSDS